MAYFEQCKVNFNEKAKEYNKTNQISFYLSQHKKNTFEI